MKKRFVWLSLVLALLITCVVPPCGVCAADLPAHRNEQTVISGRYTLVNAETGLAFAYSYGWNGLNYKPMVQTTADSSAEQRFSLKHLGSGKYTLNFSVNGGGCVHVERGLGTAQAADPLSGRSPNGSEYQQFYVTPVKGGYVLQNVMNPSLVIAPSGTGSGASLRLAAYDSKDKKQIWKLNFVDSLPFKDLYYKDFYMDALRWAYSSGVTSGVSADAFGPSLPCTRAQTITFLWRAFGKPASKLTTLPFRDVHSDDYFYPAVLWALENHITNGTGDTTFSPDAYVTRGQTVTFLWRSENTPKASGKNPFGDVHSSDYYYDAVLWAVSRGITNGVSSGSFAPESRCTRGQIVTFLYRDLE